MVPMQAAIFVGALGLFSVSTVICSCRRVLKLFSSHAQIPASCRHEPALISGGPSNLQCKFTNHGLLHLQVWTVLTVQYSVHWHAVLVYTIQNAGESGRALSLFDVTHIEEGRF